MLTDKRVKERVKMTMKEEKEENMVVTSEEEMPVLNIHPREMSLVKGESGTLNFSLR